mmetsp:Transcript_40717/g.68165  ORF Transcript_40717/g.68165 Transcript_40717/m.68165 type:complete len:349 (-) Transcript_40717:238-1284(-)|eukprot:CAMPEP_0198212574 /NCGR_PEP_ID=MMETSP1445-20131203/26663_1 /TAXON_ID=36898 /ORGANISM="Pyramimonas sp., Strain CCMP2087" /LENGTH=348 /DNA_ID=CAMNT_0043887053 /DNA_START=147 /DNA_END=1193 /DNA_ORIENTATION=+
MQSYMVSSVGRQATVPRHVPLQSIPCPKVITASRAPKRANAFSALQRPRVYERKPQHIWRRCNQVISARSSTQSDETDSINPAAASLMLDMLANPSLSFTSGVLPSAAFLPALVSGMLLIPADSAEAALLSADGIPEWALNGFGFLYIACFGLFVLKLFRKRAKFATTQTLATKQDQNTVAAKYKKITNPLDAFGGALVAFALAYVFYKASVKIDAGFAGKNLPGKYEIAQIVITIRTIVSGLAYLATFVFGLNAAGLFLLGLTNTFEMITGKGREEEVQMTGAGTSVAEQEFGVNDRELTTVEAYLAKKEKEAVAKPKLKPNPAARPIFINRNKDLDNMNSLDDANN